MVNGSVVLVFEADTKANMLRIREIFRDFTARYPEISTDWVNDVV